MTNEKSNSNNWKTNLEDAAALQEYTLQNKGAAWESLYGKLYKKHKPKFLWYWLAAACLIATFSVIVFMHQPADNNITTPVAIKQQSQQNIISKQESQQPVVEKIDTRHEVAKVKSINIHKHVTQPFDKNEIIVTSNPVLQHTELNAIKVEPSIIKDSAVIVNTTAVALKPKKMKIVHVNELDDDGSNINMVQNKVPSRIKILNQDIYTDYTLSVPASGFSILKHKNSPSN